MEEERRVEQVKEIRRGRQESGASERDLQRKTGK